MGSHITRMLFALHAPFSVLYRCRWPGDGQLTETCRPDKSKIKYIVVFD